MSNLQVFDGSQSLSVSGGLQIRTVEDLSRISKMLASSGYFTDAKDAAQCGVKVLAGAEMGFGAFSSMTGIHLIKGKPSVGAGLMASAVKRHPKYNYRVLEHTEQACRIAFYEKWDGKYESVGESSFTLADAKKAGTQNLDKYARNMLFARAMSNGVKWYCPDVFDTPVYTPEEMGAAVDSEGEYVETIATTPAPKPAKGGSDPDWAKLLARNPKERIGQVNEVLKLPTEIIKDLGLQVKEDEPRARASEIINAMFYAWGADNQYAVGTVRQVLEDLYQSFPNLVDEELAQAVVAELHKQAPMVATPRPRGETVAGVAID